MGNWSGERGYSGREWLRQYDRRRQLPFNRRAHAVGLPLAALGLLMMLWSLQLQPNLPLELRLLNPALLAVMVTVAYGFLIAPFLALLMALLSMPVLLLVAWLDGQGLALSWSGAALVLAGWLLLLGGHRREGRRLLFAGGLQYLPVGLYWLLDRAISRLTCRQ